jgi:hypothetical protein
MKPSAVRDNRILSPPYRLEEASDVEAFLEAFPDKDAEGWRSFARNRMITKPAIIGDLPERFYADVQTLRTEFFREVREVDLPEQISGFVTAFDELKELVTAVAINLPESFFDMSQGALEEGRELLRLVSNKDKLANKESGKPSARLSRIDGVRLLPEVLGEMLFYLLNRREEGFARFLKQTLLACELYNNEYVLDTVLLETIQNEPSDSSRLFEALQGVVEAIRCRRSLVFRPYMRRFLTVVEAKIISLKEKGGAASAKTPRALSSLKSNVLAVLQDVADFSGDMGARAAEANEQLEQIYSVFAAKVSPLLLTKFRSITDNYLEKSRAFADFYSRNFFVEKVEAAARIFNRCNIDTGFRTVRLYTGVRLWFFPCKDYMDYLKGEASADCTTSSGLAGAHLLNPRFFNIRIFAESKDEGEGNLRWVGNIYCLDHTQDRKTLVIDRIQMRKAARIFPQRFFPIFMEVLIKSLSSNQGFSIIAPQRISNFSAINESFEEYCRSCLLTSFPYVKDDTSFECRKCSRFYLLY